jgi:hypothetical protein
VLEFVNKYARNYTCSQNGEEGILLECFARMAIRQGHCVEVGGNDGWFCSNTALLLERGWSGTFIESEWPLYLKCQANWSHRKDVTCTCHRVDGHSVNFYVKDNCDLLSIDTDGEDFGIFKGLEAKPKVVIVEIDSRIPPEKDEFSAQGGAGFRPMLKLGIEKGYFLLCHIGNMVFVDEKYRALFPEVDIDPMENPQAYFLDAILTGDRGYLSA